MPSNPKEYRISGEKKYFSLFSKPSPKSIDKLVLFLNLVLDANFSYKGILRFDPKMPSV